MGSGAAKAARHRDRRFHRIRRAAVRPGRRADRPRNQPPGLRQAAGQAPRAADVPSRQAPVPRRRRSDQPARHRRDQVPDRPERRCHRRRRRQAAEGRRQGHRGRPKRRCRACGDDEGIDLEGLEVSGGEEMDADGVRARRRRRRADRALRQQADARCHPPRRLGHPLRTLREDLSACASASTAC